jgi:hypothetical protein
MTGFLTARYLSTAKLEMVRDEAVHEMKKLIFITVFSLTVFSTFPRDNLK